MQGTPLDQELPLDRLKGRQFRIVLLNSAYDTMESPQTQSLLGQIAAFKIRGYRSEYPYGVLPLDAVDFVGCHLLLCEETVAGLKILVGMKSITLDRCRVHALEFPALHLLDGQNLPDHRLALEEAIERSTRLHHRLGYNGSWTIHPEVRTDRVVRQLCYDATVVFFARYYRDYEIGNVIAAATVQFKVERFKEYMGFGYMEHKGKRLDSFPYLPYPGCRVILMNLTQASAEADALAARYDTLWRNRLVIASEAEFTRQIAA